MKIKKDYTRAITWIIMIGITYAIWSTIFKITS